MKNIKGRKNGKRKNLIFEANKYMCCFRQFERIRSFPKNIFAGKITSNDADKN